jgi:GMP synthase (glutamine-hydrolysing)
MTDSRPVLILQHLTSDGPAYLATWLARAGIAYDCRDAEAGEAYPDDIEPYRALAVLGGAMSANDDLPTLRQAERLIAQAMARGRPVLGHCLGGQLMARVLGGQVMASPAPEIGWQPLAVVDHPAARHWFGDTAGWDACHWHYEAFSLPPGSVPVATSVVCPNQAFVVERGGVQHLAMQFHIEVDAEKLHAWSWATDEPYRQAQRDHPSSVSSGAAMRADCARALPIQQAVADRVYAAWLAPHGAARV